MTHESWLYNFDPWVHFPVDSGDILLSCILSCGFLKGGTFNFQLLSKKRRQGQKTDIYFNFQNARLWM